MTRFRAFLLAAAVGAGLPTLAAAQDFQRGGGDRQDRQPRGEARGERPQPAAPQAQPAPQQPAEQPRQFERQPRPQAQAQAQAPGQFDQRRRFDGGDRPTPDGGFRQQAQGFDPGRRGGGDRREAFRQSRSGGDQGRPGFADNRVYGRDDRNGYARNDGRFDNRGGGRNWQAPGPSGRIGADWRQDRRFDWRGYRDSHREAFRVGRYVAPRGYSYGYRPFSIGFRLAPYFYASNYWIDDPYDYRLPPVWGSYRWVRYYDDVLLVDLSTGEVVDAIQGFFW